jgi:hypothetical protein
MITRDELDTMSPSELLAEFDELCKMVFPDHSQESIGYELVSARSSVSRWRQKKTVPLWAILLLQEWSLRGSHLPPNDV